MGDKKKKARKAAAMAMAGAVAAMGGGAAEAAEPFKPQMLSANPSKVAQTLMSDYATGKTTKEIYTDPHIVWHSYEGFDKLRRFDKPAPASPPPTGRRGSRYADMKIERVQVIDGGNAVTVLMSTRLKTVAGREFVNEAASIHFLNAEGKIYRVEAYYDPTEQRMDSFYREHMQMYDGRPDQ